MIAALALSVWAWLFLAHGRFWLSRPELPPAEPREHPDVDIVVPARDEATTIARVIASLLAQDYRGRFRVILVDDNSSDGTAAAAGTAARLHVITGLPKPPGWSGKLWALHQGIMTGEAPLILLTDADIEHDPRHLSSLVAGLESERADKASAGIAAISMQGLGMVSEMVHLNCTSLAERALVPAFVYFFQMLYPFARVNAPRSRVAAAAGGTILIRRDILERSGGITAIRGALIDDVALATCVKRVAPIYLGHSGLATSIRPYPRWSDLWAMISRTAFTQLRHSPTLLLLTLVGLTLVWLVPVAAMLGGNAWSARCGAAAYALAAITYLPTLIRYRANPLWALCLPAIALFYMAATLGSALNHWRGVGARWKNRRYEA
jgi:hopene-associated glycosyltransferase HpnB